MARKKKIVEEIKETIIVDTIKEEKKVIDLPDYYMLKIGETLEDVSKKFGISEIELRNLNDNPEVFGGNQIKLK